MNQKEKEFLKRLAKIAKEVEIMNLEDIDEVYNDDDIRDIQIACNTYLEMASIALDHAWKVLRDIDYTPDEFPDTDSIINNL